MLEIEVKLFLETEEAARDVCRLLALPWISGTLERNLIFDFPDRRLRRQGALVRVRERGAETMLTYKEKTDEMVEGAKSRLEYETAVSRRDAVLHLLGKLGLKQVFAYERHRARHPLGDGYLEIDHMPGGWFCEIEGSAGTLAGWQRAAGLGDLVPVVWSYPEIFEALQTASGTKDDWTFEAFARGAFRLPPPDNAFWQRASQEH